MLKREVCVRTLVNFVFFCLERAGDGTDFVKTILRPAALDALIARLTALYRQTVLQVHVTPEYGFRDISFGGANEYRSLS